MPLFSALMAIIIFKEKFQLFHFIGATFIVTGIYLSNRENPMIKVAVLDDYQNAFRQIIDFEKHKNEYDFKVFSEPFLDEKETIDSRKFRGSFYYERKNSDNEKLN